jgi:NAD(P)-dependent dehydrogenase (short-subunit alcohol dehydrogenase family)
MQGLNVALVTGSSSGIGFETALLLARTGFHTNASMRNLEKSKNIIKVASTEKLSLQVVQLNVNDDRSVKDDELTKSILINADSLSILIDGMQMSWCRSIIRNRNILYFSQKEDLKDVSSFI